VIRWVAVPGEMQRRHVLQSADAAFLRSWHLGGAQFGRDAARREEPHPLPMVVRPI
jgi:hypothetical protein